MVTVDISQSLLSDRRFFGHPRGLAYLAFTEAWERFSFYGMRALVVLFMVQELLLPGHIENVAGMATLRALLEQLTGPLSTQALASLIFGFYGGLVYFTPLVGGWIADRWLGAKRTVLIGVFLMTAGHGLMVFEQSFLAALLLLILGSGCLKGNIAAQVGQLYEAGDESRATRGFVLFSTGINIGAILGPVICGALGEIYGWHVGFGTAGICMLFACAIYLAGQKHLPDERPKGEARIVHPPLTGQEWRVIGLLCVLLIISIPQSMAYDQQYNVGIIWVSQYVDLSTPIGRIPVTWFNSIDSVICIAVVPLLVGLWARLAKVGREPSDISKVGLGAATMAMSSGCLAISAALAGEGKIGAFLPLFAYSLSGLAFMLHWPTILAIVSRLAPRQINARMVSFAYMSLFFQGIITGYMGTWYEKMTPSQFWIMTAALPAIASIVILIFGRSLKRALEDAAAPQPVLHVAAA